MDARVHLHVLDHTKHTGNILMFIDYIFLCMDFSFLYEFLLFSYFLSKIISRHNYFMTQKVRYLPEVSVFVIFKKSLKSTFPSWLKSASSNISCTSRSLNVCSNVINICLKSFIVICPFCVRSNTLNVCRASSSSDNTWSFFVVSSKNSGKSIAPLPSASVQVEMKKNSRVY